jgi:hypothetical protein
MYDVLLGGPKTKCGGMSDSQVRNVLLQGHWNWKGYETRDLKGSSATAKSIQQ